MNTMGTAFTALVASTLLVTNAARLHSQQPPALPAGFADYIAKHVGLTSTQRARLMQGEPVTRLLQTDSSHEIAVFGATWINAPMTRYIAAVKDIEQFEKGDNFRVTKRISSPPQRDDFALFKLPPNDLADLKTCTVGDCELKMSESALLRFRREVDWSKPTATADAETLARRLALDYVNGYLEGGNSRLAVYRDSSRPTFVGQEFASMIERLPSMTDYLPEIRKYLLEFPKTSLPNSTSFLYWQEAQFGLKPTIRVNHLTIVERPKNTVIASKMLYASHYFWTALELRVLAPDSSRGGFWFASVNRSRSDGLSGFTGSLIRGKVRGETEKGMQSALETTKASMEQPSKQE